MNSVAIAATMTNTTPMETSLPWPEAARPGGPVFQTTHWSVVLEAGRPDSPRAAEALAVLCRAYWSPLYAYARRHGHEADESRDLESNLEVWYTAKWQRLALRHLE